MRKPGLRSYYAEAAGIRFNWAAGLAWIVTLGCCTFLVLQEGVQIFFVSLPGWFIAAILYITLSRLLQRRPSNIKKFRGAPSCPHRSGQDPAQ